MRISKYGILQLKNNANKIDKLKLWDQKADGEFRICQGILRISIFYGFTNESTDTRTNPN